jgi:hypothetical protein
MSVHADRHATPRWGANKDWKIAKVAGADASCVHRQEIRLKLKYGIREIQMASRTSTIQVSGLGKGDLTALRAQAKAKGMSAEEYARQLIEEAIALEQKARSTTLDELWAPVQDRFEKSGMTEEDLDKLVDAARLRHHRRASRKTA